MKNKISTFFTENANAKSSQIDYSYFAEQFLSDYDFEQEFDAQSFIDGFQEYLNDQNAFVAAALAVAAAEEKYYACDVCDKKVVSSEGVRGDSSMPCGDCFICNDCSYSEY